MSSTAQFLKSARVKAGLSQNELAHKLGWGTGQLVYNIEKAKAWPPKAFIRKMAKLLGVKMQDLAAVIVSDKQMRIQREYLKFL